MMIHIKEIVGMDGMMNKLTKTKLNEIYLLGENRTGKPIFIDFYADW